MNKQFGAAALGLAVAISAAGGALAQAPTSQDTMMQGFYAGVQGGYNWMKNSDINVSTATGSSTFGGGSPCGGGGALPACQLQGPWRLSNGWLAGATAGYAFGFGPRLELEAAYRRDNVKTVIHTGAPPHRDAATGYIGQFSLMTNVAYDFYVGMPIIPYIGIGLGAVNVKADGVTNKNSGANEIVNGSAWTMGLQGFVGADYVVTQALRIGVRYNYLQTTLARDVHDRNANGTVTSARYNIDPTNQTVMLTASYNFGAPRVVAAAPAPVAAPAPALQRNFLVFFDFDKSDITPEADRVIVQAANNAKTASVTRITLTGHTDRAGPVAYNQRLSERRADAVKARLVREGIAAGSIVTIGRGESSTLVPTADGVREPQNRRVEIVL